VQACNADGVWNTTADSFSFKLPPRFHETIAFRVTVAVSGLGLVVYLWWIWHLRRKHAQLRQTRDLLESKVQERTSELRNEIEERKLMQLEVERVHQQLLEISRQAGMAEIATNVLHNVGNVLNSVNISTGLIVESVKASRASNLAKVVTLLGEHAHDLGEFITNDPRGKHVPAHLAQLSEHLLADQEAIVGELDSLRRNVEHIKEIVAMQQNYATVGGVKEMINVVNLVEDSLRMNEGALNRHRVEVIREFEEVPPINIEKHKILQILVNLVGNAKHACQESERTDKRLTMRVGDGDGRIKISVMDNGVGIPPENLTRIFNHGFTTRKEGHGFGLHSGALAAKELGGSLTVQSEGLGKGATFTLELPLKAPVSDTTLRKRAKLEPSRQDAGLDSENGRNFHRDEQ
jgi:signal transduction histidine kinase